MSKGELVGYARVSTLDQDHTTQIERLNGAGCEKLFSEKQSGTTKKKRTALSES
jgi:DNA invertase Pin-like site-specific DNA recombinase